MTIAERSLIAALPAVLEGVSDEMELLVALGQSCESAIARLSSMYEFDAEMVEDIQNLDVLLQHLSELRGFLMILASGVTDDDSRTIEYALSALKLGGLRARLAEAIAGDQARYICAEAGELDLL